MVLKGGRRRPVLRLARLAHTDDAIAATACADYGDDPVHLAVKPFGVVLIRAKKAVLDGEQAHGRFTGQHWHEAQ